MKKSVETKMITAAYAWLAQFGVEAVNVNVFDELTIDATTDTKSMKAFIKKAKNEMYGFRFVVSVNSHNKGGRWVTYTVYPTTEKNNCKLGYLTFRTIPASTQVVVEIANDF